MITRTVLNSIIFVILCHSAGLSRYSCLFSSLITPNRKYNKVAYWLGSRDHFLLLGWSEEKEEKCEDNKILAVSSTIPSTNYAIELHVLY